MGTIFFKTRSTTSVTHQRPPRYSLLPDSYDPRRERLLSYFMRAVGRRGAWPRPPPLPSLQDAEAFWNGEMVAVHAVVLDTPWPLAI
jgi:hypothetical protein